jgi:hypothetical protein
MRKSFRKTRKSFRKTRKTRKSCQGGNNCKSFCKNVYSPFIEKEMQEMAKEHNVPYKPTKDDIKYRMGSCKQNFCNNGCKGYKFFSKKEEQDFKKNIKGNFIKKMKKNDIDKIKSQGAISYCDYIGYKCFQ